jgi:gamma-glutamyltranspeptidase/glutathione hydrolase
VIVDVIDRGLDIARAESLPRIHNQWLPDQVFAEPGISADVIAGLQARGDKVVSTGKFTSVNSIVVTPDGFVGAADPRTAGGLAIGY